MPTFACLVIALLLWLPTSSAPAAARWPDGPASRVDLAQVGAAQAGWLQASPPPTGPSNSRLSNSRPAQASPSQTAPRPRLRILFVGNSLTYVNNLPRMVQAIAAAQPGGARIDTSTFTAPGGRLVERWEDGAAPEALRKGHWDAVVLQEASGLLVCMGNPEQRRARTCRDSERTHKRFAALAAAAGARVLVYATWGPDESWNPGMERGHDLLLKVMRSTGAQVELVPAARALDRLASQAPRQPARPDGVHPSVSASLVIAALMYRGITGQVAGAHDVTIDFRLLPVNAAMDPRLPLESQAHLAGDGKTIVLKDSALAPLLRIAYAGQ